MKTRTRSDFALLREALQIESLAAEHPARRSWELDRDARQVQEARFEFHHLASDLRAVQGVPGAHGLLAAMRKDVEGYADYRYELRIAGAVARSPGQKLLALAGKDAGPDIELETKSGHRCGIACYRARTATPDLMAIGETTSLLAHAINGIVASSPVGVGQRVDMVVELPGFPVAPAERNAAIACFEELWSQPQLPEAKVVRNGLSVARVAVRRTSIPFISEVGLKFRLPVPARERLRLGKHIRDKLRKEDGRWARKYPGVSVLSVEESDFCLGIDRKELEALVAPDQEHSFYMVLSTLQFFVDARTRGRFRVEQIDWMPRILDLGFNLGYETFGENLAGFRDGHAMMSFHPNHAEEEWLLMSGAPAANLIVTRQRPLNIVRKIARAPLPSTDAPLSGEALRPIINELLPRVRG